MKNKIIILISIGIVFVMSLGMCLNIYADDEKQAKIQEGYYKIPASLWHFKEDKESMGNQGLEQEAEIHKTDKGTYLYIHSKKMEFSSLISALINIYYLDESSKVYKRSKGYDYNISLTDIKEKFPTLFEIPINNEKEFIEVMVDPKVEVMGDQPIKARIKLDFSNIKKIDESESSVLKKLKNAKEKSKDDFDFVKISRKASIRIDKNSFDKEFDFYSNKVTGEEEQKIQDMFKQEVIVSYKMVTFPKIEEIPLEYAIRINEHRQEIQPKEEIQVSIEKDKNLENFDLYRINQNKKTKIDYDLLDDNIVFLTDKLGVFSLVETENAEVKSNDEDEKTAKSSDEKTNDKNMEKPSNDAIQKEDKNQSDTKAQNFLANIKNLSKKSVNQNSGQSSTGILNNNSSKAVNNGQANTTNVKIYTNSNNKSNENENKEEKKEKEHYGIIFLSISFIIIVIILSICVIRKYYLQIIEEVQIYKEINQRKNEK